MYYYLTATETTQLGLTTYLAIGAFLLALLAHGTKPKRPAWDKYAKQAQAPVIAIVIVFLIWLAILSAWSDAWAAGFVNFNLVLSP